MLAALEREHGGHDALVAHQQRAVAAATRTQREWDANATLQVALEALGARHLPAHGCERVCDRRTGYLHAAADGGGWRDGQLDNTCGAETSAGWRAWRPRPNGTGVEFWSY